MFFREVTVCVQTYSARTRMPGLGWVTSPDGRICGISGGGFGHGFAIYLWRMSEQPTPGNWGAELA